MVSRSARKSSKLAYHTCTKIFSDKDKYIERQIPYTYYLDLQFLKYRPFLAIKASQILMSQEFSFPFLSVGGSKHTQYLIELNLSVLQVRNFLTCSKCFDEIFQFMKQMVSFWLGCFGQRRMSVNILFSQEHTNLKNTSGRIFFRQKQLLIMNCTVIITCI